MASVACLSSLEHSSFIFNIHEGVSRMFTARSTECAAVLCS